MKKLSTRWTTKVSGPPDFRGNVTTFALALSGFCVNFWLCFVVFVRLTDGFAASRERERKGERD